MRLLFALVVSSALLAQTPKTSASAKPTIAEARAFLDKPERHLLDLSNEAGRATWLQATYITEDTEAMAAQTTQRAIAAGVEYAKQARRFDNLPLPEDLQRKIKLLKVALTLPAPANQKESEELTRIVTGMESLYGKGKYCPTPAPSSGDTKD